MRISVTIIIVLATLGFLAGVASAGKVKLQGTYSADDFLKGGVQKAQRGDYSGAIEDYNQAIRIDPKLT